MNRNTYYTQLNVVTNKLEYEKFKNIVNQTPHKSIIPPSNNIYLNKNTKLKGLSSSNNKKAEDHNNNIYKNNLIKKMNKIEINNYNFNKDSKENLNEKEYEFDGNIEKNKEKEINIKNDVFYEDLEKLNYELCFIKYKYKQLFNKINENKKKSQKKELDLNKNTEKLSELLRFKNNEINYLKLENQNLLKLSLKKYPNYDKIFKELTSKLSKYESENLNLKSKIIEYKKDNDIIKKKYKINQYQLKEKLNIIKKYEEDIFKLESNKIILKGKKTININNNDNYFNNFFNNKIKYLKKNNKTEVDNKINIKNLNNLNNRQFNNLKSSLFTNRYKKNSEKNLSSSIEKFNINASYYFIKDGKIYKK